MTYICKKNLSIEGKSYINPHRKICLDGNGALRSKDIPYHSKIQMAHIPQGLFTRFKIQIEDFERMLMQYKIL